jgi:hypothetical protein
VGGHVVYVDRHLEGGLSAQIKYFLLDSIGYVNGQRVLLDELRAKVARNGRYFARLLVLFKGVLFHRQPLYSSN